MADVAQSALPSSPVKTEDGLTFAGTPRNLATGVALILGYPFQPGAFSLLLLATFVFAAGEEIGWRGYLLPRLLARGVSPLRASFWIGIPWAIIHLPLTLPGKLAAGVPPEAQFLMLLSLSVMTTWVYLGAKRNILAPTLLHGGQNALVVLNDHLPLVATNWWMAGVFGGVALALVVGTRGRLTSAETNFRIQTSGFALPVSPGRALDRPDQSRR